MKKIFIIFILIFPIIIFSYNRKNWKHWSSIKCRNTRNQVLVERSLIKVKFKTSKKCRVISGKWKSFFTGDIITNPRKIDIDHTVPLGWAAAHGGESWKKDRKKRYANFRGNTYHLVITEASLNRAKGKKGIDEWLPPKTKCYYITVFMLIVNQWDLKFSPEELIKIEKISKEECIK